MISFKAGRPNPLVIVSLVLVVGCSGDPSIDDPSLDPSSITRTAVPDSSTEVWWQRIHELCGKAFAGRLVSEDEVDARFSGQPMTMHVRRCGDGAAR